MPLSVLCVCGCVVLTIGLPWLWRNCSPEEKSTHYLQYTYLLLYLRRRAENAMSPLERMVRDKVCPLLIRITHSPRRRPSRC
jgi:hypothetical protein